jgi:hypothetical protein
MTDRSSVGDTPTRRTGRRPHVAQTARIVTAGLSAIATLGLVTSLGLAGPPAAPPDQTPGPPPGAVGAASAGPGPAATGPAGERLVLVPSGEAVPLAVPAPAAAAPTPVQATSDASG